MILRKTRVLAFLVLLTLISSIALHFANPERVKVASEKTAIFLKLNIYSDQEASFEFYIGSGVKQAGKTPTVIIRERWWEETENIWKRIPEIVYGALGNTIREAFNETTLAEDFVKLVLGCENTVKRISFVNYSNGISFLGEVSLKGRELKLLEFLPSNLLANAEISINVDSELGIETSELTLLHFRLVTKELLIYSATKNKLYLVNITALSPFGGFIILLACTALSLSLGFYSRKYFRGAKLYAPIWVLAWMFYFCAFIPLSNYIFVAICIIGVAISSARVIINILRARPKPPKKETIELKEVGKKVEKYLK